MVIHCLQKIVCPQSDPIHEAVFNLLGDGEAKQRKILTVDNVTQDERGLRQLIEVHIKFRNTHVFN